MKMETVLRRLISSIILAGLLSCECLATSIRLIPAGDVWKYLDNGSDPGTAWRYPGFDDSTWAAGRAQLGYGDGDEVTVVGFGPNAGAKYITTYFRKQFIVGDLITLSNITLRVLRDDGAVVYINGVEVFRSNMPNGPITSGTPASSAAGGADETTNFYSAAVPANLLHYADNVIAVEVHQNAANSSDLSFDLELVADVRSILGLPQVSVTASDDSASEISPLLDRPEDPGVFRISRTGPTDGPLSAFVSLAGTAENGVDYTLIPEQVEIPPGAQSVDVYVSVLDDSQSEPTETVQLIISRPPCADNPVPQAGCYDLGFPASATVSILDDDRGTNLPPTVQIISPTNGTVFNAPATINIFANANDPNGYLTVKTVEFFESSRSLGIRTNYPTLAPVPPFFVTWAGVPAGEYTFLAIATDDAGARGTSAPVHVSVQSTQSPPVMVTIVPMGAVWSYFDRGIDLGTSWRILSPAANDSAWLSGPAQLGYGDGDEATVVSFGPDPMNKYITTYFRRIFGVTNAGNIGRLIGRLRQDDGAVVYLNGTEIFRGNLPAGDISFNTLALAAVEDQIVEFVASPAVLVNGPNVLAVEMHQVNGTSSDLSFDLELLGEIGTPSDLPVVNVTATDPNASETGTLGFIDSGTFTFYRTGNLQDGLAVSFSISGSASNGVDYIRVTNRASFAPGAAETRLNITPLNDNMIEGSETVVVRLESPPCAAMWPPPPDCYRPGPSNQAVVTIRDNSGGTNQAPHVTIVTPANNARFPVGSDILLGANAPTTTGQVVGLEFLANGLKIGDADGPLATPAGAWLLVWSNVLAGEYNITARATDDRGVVGYSAPVHITVGTNRPPTGVGVFAADAWAAEGPSSSNTASSDVGIFRFWRDGATDAPLTVFYSLGGDAINGSDYQMLANSVTMPAGTSVVDVVVRALDDLLVEPTETVVLTLQSNTAYRVGTSNNPAATRATVYIVDNDPVETNHPPSVRLTRPLGGDVFYTPANIELAAFAQDTEDLYTLTVEFFADGRSLGAGAFVPSRCVTCPYYSMVWSNVPPGRHTITARATDSRGATTTSAPVTITVNDGSSADRELHAVSVYSGDVNGSWSNNHERGNVSVQVNRPSKRVTLFLASYEPVLWNVSVQSNTVIEKVILGGYYAQSVEGLPPGVQIINRFYDEGHGTGDYLYMGYAADTVRFYRTMAKLCELTGLDLATFQGAYVASAFTIDQVVNDVRFRCDYPQPVDPSTLPDLSFRVAFYGGGQVFFQNYTLSGPQDGTRLLPALRVVADAGGRYYYGNESQGMLRIDSQTGTSEGMDLGAGVPELSWPTGVAFDSQRNHVLLSSLGGEGFLYGYSPVDNAWSLISSLHNIDVNGIGYHPANDSIYAVASTYEDYHPRVLYRFDASGQPNGQVQLPVMPFNFGPSGYETELVSVGEYLVLLVEPSYGFFYGDGPRESRIYLIDPRTSEVFLTYRRSFLSDTDHDGVPDDRDHCPYTPPGAVVDANGCPVDGDSDGDGVANSRDQCPGTSSGSIVNAQGCSLQQLCPCNGPWTNHAQYVDCVIRHTWQFYREGLISTEQRRAIVGQAVMSGCGRTVNEPLCMHLLPQTTEECHRDGLGFIFTGDVTGSCVIECSSNLINWTPIQTEGVAVTGQEIVCPASGDGPRFYRLRLEP